jgi:hypothetical protein
MAMKKPKADELYVALQAQYDLDGGFVPAGSKRPGSDPVVKLRPLLWAAASGGQPEIDRVSREFELDVGRAAQNRERAWYGTPEPAVATVTRAICVKAFRHHGQEVAVGSLWSKSDPLVESTPNAFVDVQD